MLIMKKKKLFLFLGILSFLCLLVAIFFLLFYDYYPVKARTEKIETYAQNDTDDYTTIGWLRVQGTDIDYPVIYAPGYDFSGKTDNFVWNEVNSDELLNQVTISGHNILNLSKNPLVADKNHQRFEQLMSFTYFQFLILNMIIFLSLLGKILHLRR